MEGEEIGRLVVRLGATGGDELGRAMKEARKASDDLRYAVDQLRAGYRAGTVDEGAYLAKTKDLNDGVRSLNEAMSAATDRERSAARQRKESADAAARQAIAERDLAKALDERGGAAARAARAPASGRAGADPDVMARRSQGAARGVQELFRGIEDFAVAGPIGALNNLPGTFEAFAMAAGKSAVSVALVGAGVSAAGTAAYLAYQNWDSLSGLWEERTTATEAERMEDLGRKTKRTAEETARLNAYKRETAEIERAVGGQSSEEKGTAEAVQAAYDEGDAPGILAGLVAARKRDGRPLMSDGHLPGEIAATREELAGQLTVQEMGGEAPRIGPLQAKLRELEAKLEAARVRDAGALMVRGKADPTALLAEMRGAPDLFPKGSIKSIEAATPKAREAQAQRALEAGGARQGRKIEQELGAKAERERAEGERVDEERFDDAIRERQRLVRERDARRSREGRASDSAARAQARPARGGGGAAAVAGDDADGDAGPVFRRPVGPGFVGPLAPGQVRAKPPKLGVLGTRRARQVSRRLERRAAQIAARERAHASRKADLKGDFLGRRLGGAPSVGPIDRSGESAAFPGAGGDPAVERMLKGARGSGDGKPDPTAEQVRVGNEIQKAILKAAERQAELSRNVKVIAVKRRR